MPGLTLWLLRHGQSTANAGQPAHDHMQIGLTEQGRAQARSAALRFSTAPDLLVVSPMLRAVQTADAVQARWPEVPRQEWPIGEFTYLSPGRCAGTTAAQRQTWVASYWERCDPHHVDGPGAESFAEFIGRVRSFHRRVTDIGGGFVVAVGHGQFFKACTLGLAQGFAATPQAMHDFRAGEVAAPMANGEVVELALGLSARTGE